MLTADASALADSLKKAEQEIERKLVGMLGKFMQGFTKVAVENTPHGDANDPRYKQRTPPWPQEPGMSKSNWQIMNTPALSPVYIADITGTPSLMDAAETYYKLGETYYLGNATPYIRSVENRYGIGKSTIDEVVGIYQQRLDDYYKQS